MWTLRTTDRVHDQVTGILSPSPAIQPPVTVKVIPTYQTINCRLAGMYCLPEFNLVHRLANKMPSLSQISTNEFIERFYSFNDSVIRKIEITYAKDGERSVVAWIETRDAKESKNEGWVCVRLTIYQAQDFCFSDAANTSHTVISHGINICWFEGIVGLDFGHFIDPPDDLDELKSSKCFVTGSSVNWTVEQY